MPHPVLTAEKRNVVIAIVSTGTPCSAAARYVGCARSTIARTAARDPEFAVRLKQAQAGVELSYLRRIDKAADKEQYWRAAAWALERLYPDRYARRKPNVPTHEQIRHFIEELARIVCEEAPADARRRIIRRVRRMLKHVRRRSDKGTSKAASSRSGR